MAGEVKCTIITAAQVIKGDVIQPDAEPGNIKVTYIERKPGNDGRMRVKINRRFEMDGDQNIILVSREVDSRMFRKLMEYTAALLKDQGVAVEWLLTHSDEFGGRAPIDFLDSSQDFERIIQLIDNLRVFKLILIRPEELKIIDSGGYEMCCLISEASQKSKPENYQACALDWLMAQGWHVVSILARNDEPKTWYVLVRRS